MDASATSCNPWHRVPVLLVNNPQIDSAIAAEAIARLRQDDPLIIDPPVTPASLAIVRDKAGTCIGIISPANRCRAEAMTGMPLPATALFERKLEFGCLLKVPRLGKSLLAQSVFSGDPGRIDGAIALVSGSPDACNRTPQDSALAQSAPAQGQRLPAARRTRQSQLPAQSRQR